MNAAKDILDIVRSINHNWLSGAYDRVQPYLHPNVVFRNTAGVVRAKGRQDCIAAFRNFVRHVHAHAYLLSREKVEMWNNTAVASYEFSMTYQVGGQDFEKRGREIIVFNKDDGNWRMVYRTLSPY